MSKIALSPDPNGAGIFTIASPNSGTNRTLTLPDNTGTILTTATGGIPINGPAFGAYLTNNQTVTSATWTKVTLDTEEFDTNNNFASNRFTPTVAGYYQLNGTIQFDATTSITRSILAIYKNGSVLKQGTYLYVSNTNARQAGVISSIVYLNGSTDYVELYGYNDGSGTMTFAASSSYFNGAMVRAA